MSTDQARNSIDYLVTDIERIQREMGPNAEIARQAEDIEAREIIRRIERRLQGKRVAPQQPEAAAE